MPAQEAAAGVGAFALDLARSAALAGAARPAPRVIEPEAPEPLYPRTDDPPDPVAERYCDIVHEVAARNHDACCPAAPREGVRPTSECARTLSYALLEGAVTIEAADLDLCELATLEEAKRCDWDGSLPRACEGIVRGQVAYLSPCRSSLECQEGFYCKGLTRAAPGACRSSQREGMPCGGGADTLAVLVRQDTELRNAKCAGHCSRRACRKPIPPGGACAASRECGFDDHCVNGICSHAPLPEAGESCARQPCGPGLVCVKGVCEALRGINEPCKSDEECRSRRCARKARKPGRCAVRCQPLRSRAVQLTGNP